jgi:hypothetical protein
LRSISARLVSGRSSSLQAIAKQPGVDGESTEQLRSGGEEMLESRMTRGVAFGRRTVKPRLTDVGELAASRPPLLEASTEDSGIFQ